MPAPLFDPRLDAAAPPSWKAYLQALQVTLGWLARSVEHGQGGSCAHLSPLGWSAPYPETTGYLIPTLLRAAEACPQLELRARARRLGQWLLGLQLPAGAWPGGLWRGNRGVRASIFNTAQVLEGMVALHDEDPGGPWIDAARRGGAWLVSQLDDQGLWTGGDYRASGMPSYYTQAAWPLLQVAERLQQPHLAERAGHLAAVIAQRRRADGWLVACGFTDDGPAPTHTLGYAIRGAFEIAWSLQAWERCGAPLVPTLDALLRRGELRAGALPGSFSSGFVPTTASVCLTGNAQLAICALRLHRYAPDLRLVSAAARLIDFVVSTQLLRWGPAALRGGVAGSWPVWGPYMRGRYPNWAAKYHADALMELLDVLRAEPARVSR